MNQIEDLVRTYFRSSGFDKDDELDYDHFHVPLQEIFHTYVSKIVDDSIINPGRIRIDAGRLKGWGLEPNSDAVIDLEFLLFDRHFLTAQYNLADELLAYADVGERAWDVFRQIDQLTKTISKLRRGAAERGWLIDE